MMNLKEFKEQVDYFCNEIGIYGDEGFISSHNIMGDVYLVDDKENYYDISDFELSRLPGCGCPSGLIINIKKDEED